MKKRILATLFLSVMSFCFVNYAFAAPSSSLNLGFGKVKQAAEAGGYSSATNENTLAETIGTVIKALFSLLGVIFLILIVYAGFLWMTARGEDSKVEEATKIIKAAVIGLIITVGAYSITNFVVPRILERTTDNQLGQSDADQEVKDALEEGEQLDDIKLDNLDAKYK